MPICQPAGYGPRTPARKGSLCYTPAVNKNDTKGDTFDELFQARVAEYGDWRGELLTAIRAIITAADPDIVEEWKWNIPVWSHDGLVCTGEVYKAAVKTTFAKGASLPDPSGLFNASLEGNARRAIDFREGDKVSKRAFTALIKAAVKHNQETKAAKRR